MMTHTQKKRGSFNVEIAKRGEKKKQNKNKRETNTIHKDNSIYIKEGLRKENVSEVRQESNKFYSLTHRRSKKS